MSEAIGDTGILGRKAAPGAGPADERPEVVESQAVADLSRETARLLVVDDQEANVRVLEGVLRRGGYANVRSILDSREVLPVYEEFGPDLVLLDLHMPHLDGFQVMEMLREQVPPSSYLPILVLTADITPEAKQRALSSGARDFLTKPFDAVEVLLRVHNLLETRRLHLRLQNANLILEEKVLDRTRELVESRVEILERLSMAAEYRDDDTGRHTKRVGSNAGLLARAIGLPEAQVELIRRAAPLHDVGKIGVPDLILLKPGKLTSEEWETMKRHTTIGAGILSGSRSALLRTAEEIALTHHERWEGGGYPAGISGPVIPLSGRIVTLVDVFDALTHDRPYKQAWPVEEAAAEIEKQSGSQFDSEVAGAFLGLVREQRIAIDPPL